MRDWNNDGKIDSRDGFVDYMIFEEITNSDKDNKTTNYSSSGAGDGATLLGVVLLIFGVIVLISWIM